MTALRIDDPLFCRAVELLDAGDAAGLREQLRDHPELVRQRIFLAGETYFQHPALLEFVAENPVRHGTLPHNIVEMARLILDAGAKEDQTIRNGTLGLVCSGRVTRECGVQMPLIELLCDYDADPNCSVGAALLHGEFAAVDLLIRRGARATLTVAAATGRVEEVRQRLGQADGEERHRALALAAQFGHAEVVRLLLDAGEDAARYNPSGCHAHSTPLHQAAFAGHDEVVRLLVERGAGLDSRDTIWNGTAADWAQHGGKTRIEEYLRAHS